MTLTNKSVGKIQRKLDEEQEFSEKQTKATFEVFTGKKKKKTGYSEKKKNALWATVAIKHSNRFGKMITKFPIKICKGNKTGTII